MTRSRFTASAAVLALAAGLGASAAAQTAPVPADLPAPIAGLNLGGLSVETRRDGMRTIEGRTADGVEIEAKVDMAGNVVEIEADDGVLPQSLVEAYVPADLRRHAALSSFGSITEVKQRPDHVAIQGRQPTGAEIEARFDRQNALVGIEVEDGAIPADLVSALLPQAVRDTDIIAQFGRIAEIENRNGRIEVEGRDANGERMRADFDADGRVLRFGRDDGRGPRHDRGGERRGGRDAEDRGPGDQRQGDRALRGPDGEGPRSERARGEGPRGAAAVPADFDAVAVNQRLTQAGYAGFGLLRADGPRLILEATNPQGEAVILELDRAGEVVRETAR